MIWYEISVYTTEEAVEAVSNYFHELGAGGVTIEESGSLNRKRDTSLGQWYDLPLNDIPEGEAMIKGYFAEPERIEDLTVSLREFLAELHRFGLDPGKKEVSVKEVDELDWANAWKQYYKPLKISDRLTVKPTWEAYEAAAGELVIELDPGMAFGTGTHATTALCLRVLEKVVRSGDEVIDVGTGSGILAIGAALLGARNVLALDLDPVAVSSAKENVSLNHLEKRISVRQSDLLSILRGRSAEGELGVSSEGDLGVALPVRVVVANILAEIILKFIPDVYEALEPDGIYIVSGIIREKEKDVETALAASGFEISGKDYEEDWVVLTARKK
ncbi:50S ribosomal protein L11 methyltransferase [Ferviditalea candida]|uniref:Ribosomal protein L11 methyltransferase n=1 Tax=Ferviditalea candida TaxID=3108399 RepID=A0ABU5ZDW4_9BACL|nr:50S ribosomal protein L11 methyltransferase [Paenibacillaceae bacterium T2]